MKTSARHVLLCSLATGGALLLGACGRHDGSTPAPAAVQVPAPARAGSAAAAAASTATHAAAMPAPAHGSSAGAPMAPASVAAPATAGSSATAAASGDDASFAVSKVVIGDAVDAGHAVTTPTESIAADHRTIYASVETRGKTDGVTLSARWSYLEGKGQLVTAISQSIATDGPAVTTFKIQNPHLWPAGKYQVEIALDGKPVSTRSFEVTSSG
ncbi:MAG: hypothetical protein KGN77_01050 [Xanthomonadaceae bacterium]|nr:hypothetical protein [Xanthomonadaceae bacterium]MDE1964070.1 hypothetical protein [Xanthomonadaceae bacterium]